jgi:hypothetical protein
MADAPYVAIAFGVNSSVRLPLPMWKETGRSASQAACHSGSQCGSPSEGWPKRCGSPVKSTPLWPFFAERAISSAVAFGSQNGVARIGMKRRGSGAIQSIRKSL